MHCRLVFVTRITVQYSEIIPGVVLRHELSTNENKSRPSLPHTVEETQYHRDCKINYVRLPRNLLLYDVLKALE